MFGVFISRDLAIDLGTANTLIYQRGRGIILQEPTMVAIRERGREKQAVAFGKQAKLMLGRTPEGVKVIRPIRTGVIADFEAAGLMLKHFLSKVKSGGFGIIKPRVIVGVPSHITEVEKRAIRESIEGHTREVKLVEEAMAAAIGCGLPVTEATANLIVDIGGGTSDIAVVSLKGVVNAISVREGGDAMDEAIINYIRRRHHLLIGEATAEALKIAAGCAHSDFDHQQVEVRGRSLVSGVPASVIIGAGEVRDAISEVLSLIAGAVRQALENTPPELSGDIISNGICLAGGGALLKGLDKYLTEELGIMARVADEPLAAVVRGAGMVLDNAEGFKGVWF